MQAQANANGDNSLQGAKGGNATAAGAAQRVAAPVATSTSGGVPPIERLAELRSQAVQLAPKWLAAFNSAPLDEQPRSTSAAHAKAFAGMPRASSSGPKVNS